MQEATDPLPFKPRDWVASRGSHERVGRVKDVYRLGGEVLLDVVLFARDGTKIGRESEAMGGPRSFEPACEASAWERIAEPAFPVALVWAYGEDGRRVAVFRAAETLGPADWVRRPEQRATSRRAQGNEAMRRALEAIAAGHNDPRRLATEVLAQHGRR